MQIYLQYFFYNKTKNVMHNNLNKMFDTKKTEPRLKKSI